MPSDAGGTRRWLGDMRYHIDLAERFSEGITCEALEGDTLRLYAVTRCREIISEASRRLPSEL